MPKIYIFIGPPGSGKGTQSDMLAKKLNIPVISTGELLRHEVSIGSELGKRVEKILANGKLVSDRLIDNIIEARIDKKDVRKGFVLDGFPRDEKQLKAFLKMLLKRKIESDDIVVFLIDVSNREVIKRLSGRRVCDCGASYHLLYNPPKKKGFCDLCGRRVTQRADDKPAVIKDRLNLYHKETEKLLKKYCEFKNFFRINGEQDIRLIKSEIIKKK